MKLLVALIAFGIGLTAVPAAMAEEAESGPGSPVVSPENLTTFSHRNPDRSLPAVVSELSVGQRSILEAQRREVRDLLARKLGILHLSGDTSDLNALQALYSRKVLKDNQVTEWQAVGVVFGDILAKEFSLKWVTYQDERGVSKALQWRDTRNFVFPLTMFSKRLQFGEALDMKAIYLEVSQDIRDFIAYETRING